MGSFSIWHWLIVLAVVLLLFGGGGKIARLMKDMGSGIKNFRKGLKDGEDESDEAEQGKLETKKEEDLETSSDTKKKSKAVNS